MCEGVFWLLGMGDERDVDGVGGIGWDVGGDGGLMLL